MEKVQNHLSTQAQVLWGKLSNNGSHYWLPLWIHLCDTGEIAELLWDHWLPKHTKQIIVEGIRDISIPCDNVVQYARQVAVFMALTHDIGKASPAFQKKATLVGFSDVWDEICGKGFDIASFNSAIVREFPHAVIGQRILELQGLDRSFAVVVGGHHGKPPKNKVGLKRVENNSHITGVNQSGWDDVQKEFVQFALDKSGLMRIPEGELSIQAQVLLAGFLIMADWIASGDGFPLISYDDSYRPFNYNVRRAQEAYGQLKLPSFGEFSSACSVKTLFHTRFSIDTPRPMQIDAMQAVLEAKHPGVFVIEAPMGEGKTEAALAAAEILARKYGLSGIYFALPTQATSDGIFKRIETWIEKLQQDKHTSIFLAHGKSGFNEDYEGIKLHSNIFTYEELDQGNVIKQREKAEQEAVIVNDWTQGRKKGLLSDFVVGTIDQILMCGLKQKHLALRHLGVANKVIIIDECHSYDTYMSSYLDLVLSWLGAYQVPVIVLSATLPPYRRKKLIESYIEAGHSKKKRKKNMIGALRQPKKTITVVDEIMPQSTSAYPLISYTDGIEIKEIASQQSGRKLTVHVELLDEEKLVDTLQILLSEGGCVGIVRNTVQKAQETAKLLEKNFGRGAVRLLHSRFISCDRVRKEYEVRYLLGPGEKQRPKKLIVIGTQVMEQSLDVDFDVLFTDICPMDLLLQRMGRLHRHVRHMSRPSKLSEATCFVMGIEGKTKFEQGSLTVYGAYLLLKTKVFLPDEIRMPDDIPVLVQKVYSEEYDEKMISVLCCEKNVIDITQICNSAKKAYNITIANKKEKSKTFQIMNPVVQGKTLVGWLNADKKEDKSGKRGEATVRDTNPSIEVIVIVKKNDGYFYTLPWLKEYGDVQIEGVPADELAKTIAGCSVSLPAYFTGNWIIDDVITDLETTVLDNQMDRWYESYWLDGELFLVLNEKYERVLLDKLIHYDERYGLGINEMGV